MITDYITHDEAVIQHFIEDPEFADLYLHTVLADGDAHEISEVQGWYNEAKARTLSLGYWLNVVDKAEQTAKEGSNLEAVITLVSKALAILQNATVSR